MDPPRDTTRTPAGPEPPRPAAAPAGGPAPPVVSSEALLAGRRELVIRHGAEEYRLRLTANNKLMLIK